MFPFIILQLHAISPDGGCATILFLLDDLATIITDETPESFPIDQLEMLPSIWKSIGISLPPASFTD